MHVFKLWMSEASFFVSNSACRVDNRVVYSMAGVISYVELKL